MTGPRRTPTPGITRQSLHTDEAGSAMTQQAPNTIAPDTEGEVLVCRSARLTPAAYRFYRAILLAFVAHSRAPEPDEVEQLSHEFNVPLEATLARMAAQDLLQRDPSTGRIRAAYPFSGVPTPHRVTLFTDHGGEQTDQIEAHVYAMCALDALGVPLMLRRAARIFSEDAQTGEAITVLIHPPAKALDASASVASDWRVSWEPVSAVVYARPAEHEAEHDAGLCQAEGTCCPITNFFTTLSMAQEWMMQRMAMEPSGALDGLVLDQQEALERANALFAGVLDRLTDDYTASPNDAPVETVVDGRTQAIETAATISCPQCGGYQLVEMPTDACQIRYTCPFCGALLRPLAGDCCVFCSYADRRCPPEQLAR
jgi:hypothetical protein